MLGIVYTEFIEMVESLFSPEIADDILQAANFDHQGAYTAVGNYSDDEIITLVTLLSERTGTSVEDLIQTYGQYLFKRFTVTHAPMLSGHHDVFSLLRHLDDHIHPEVQKLYSNASPPSFKVIEQTSDSLVMDYRSHRNLQQLAIGLIEGAAQHFNQTVSTQTTMLDDGAVRFTVKAMSS